MNLEARIEEIGDLEERFRRARDQIRDLEGVGDAARKERPDASEG